MSRPIATLSVHCPECGSTMRRRHEADGRIFLRCEHNHCRHELRGPLVEAIVRRGPAFRFLCEGREIFSEVFA